MLIFGSKPSGATSQQLLDCSGGTNRTDPHHPILNKIEHHSFIVF